MRKTHTPRGDFRPSARQSIRHSLHSRVSSCRPLTRHIAIQESAFQSAARAYSCNHLRQKTQSAYLDLAPLPDTLRLTAWLCERPSGR